MSNSSDSAVIVNIQVLFSGYICNITRGFLDIYHICFPLSKSNFKCTWNWYIFFHHDCQNFNPSLHWNIILYLYRWLFENLYLKIIDPPDPQIDPQILSGNIFPEIFFFFKSLFFFVFSLFFFVCCHGNLIF